MRTSPRCQATIFSEATRHERRCRNSGTYDGFCRFHAKEKQRVAPPPPPSQAEDVRELPLAREVIARLREFLRDPGTKGRLIHALGEYDERG